MEENKETIVIRIEITRHDFKVALSKKDRYRMHSEIAKWFAGGKEKRVVLKHWEIAKEVLEKVDEILQDYGLTIFEKGGETNE